jgi:hypothetical protein
MGRLPSRTSHAKISMYLGSSKYWWAYLGIKSNSSILPLIEDRFDRVVFFDDLTHVQPGSADAKRVSRYFLIAWDGVSDERWIDDAQLSLGNDADLTVLVVGDSSQVSPGKYRIQNLYPEGALKFTVSPLRFDLRTAALIVDRKFKCLLMPLKNLAQSRGRVLQTIDLLLGRKRVVFCGSYGTNPGVVESLCRRHAVDFSLFEQYDFYCRDPNPSLETYRTCLRNDGQFLADLYDRVGIHANFFLSMVHLLGREYFVEKIRASGLASFINGYATGANINVYTTPFYAQHVFLDFGSVVGTGNYPRLADLQYFRKTFVEIALTGDLNDLLALARSGTMERRFEQEWELKFPQILQSMGVD